MKAKRWYLKFSVHCANISKVNGWLMYRRHVDQISIKKKKQMALSSFSTKIANGLLYKLKLIDRPVGRRSKRKSLDDCSEGLGKRAITPP